MPSNDSKATGCGRSDIAGGDGSTMGNKRGVGGSVTRGDIGGARSGVGIIPGLDGVVGDGVGIIPGLDGVVSDGVDDGDDSISLSSFGSRGGGRGGKPAIMPC